MYSRVGGVKRQEMDYGSGQRESRCGWSGWVLYVLFKGEIGYEAYIHI